MFTWYTIVWWYDPCSTYIGNFPLIQICLYRNIIVIIVTRPIACIHISLLFWWFSMIFSMCVCSMIVIVIKIFINKNTYYNTHWTHTSILQQWILFINNNEHDTMWGPCSIAKLVYNSNFTRVYGTQIPIVFMGFINQQTSLGGPTWYEYGTIL